VDADRIGPDGAKLECTKCPAVFLVRAPKMAEPAPPVEAPVPVDVAAQTTPSAQAPETSKSARTESPEAQPSAHDVPEPPEPAEDVDRERLVLIADQDDARGKASAEAVRSWGLHAYLVQDGVEAMLAIQRLLPRAVVLDAALPRMLGVQVCEVVKRNESLRDTAVVLVGAIHDQARYRQDPSDLYGADVNIEQPDLPDGLKPILRESGLPLGGSTPPAREPAVEGASAPEPAFGSSAPEPAPEPAFGSSAPEPAPEPAFGSSAPEPAPEPTFEAPSAAPEPALGFVSEPPVTAPTEVPAADEDPETAEERERALRLARIAVSEMLLYQPEKFEQAARDGNLEQALDREIQEARALLRQRIREDVREETDFISDELNRVAAERSVQG